MNVRARYLVSNKSHMLNSGVVSNQSANLAFCNKVGQKTDKR